jgi:hypothetical protein
MSQQLALPLEPGAEPESALKYAWSRTRLKLPYHVAIHVPALAICLRNIAAADKRRRIRRTLRTRPRQAALRWKMDGIQ